MAYKGSDLNLRSGNPWPPREVLAAEEGGSNGGRTPSIAVDDAVLACCNQAYDVAQVHGAGEVRLEHLLHAMTRVRPAIDLLDQLGVRTARLRQETAVAIASEAPAGSDGKGSLRTSDETREVLQRAAALGAERKAPASVADLLRVLLSLGRKAPATILLMRAASDVAALERWRDEPRREAMRDSLQAAADMEARAQRPNLADALFKRLDGMEAALRALQVDIAAERRAITDALAQRVETSTSGGIAQIQSLASALEGKLEANLSSLGDRLAGLDKLEKLASGESLSYLGARIEVIEKQLAKQSKDILDSVSNLLLEHLVKTEGETGSAAVGGDGERMAALEASIDTHLQRADEAAKTHEHSLAEIYEALVKLGTNQQTLASNLNTWRVESSGDVSIISNRLEEMQRTAQETLARLDGQVQALRLAAVSSVGNGNGEQRGMRPGFKRWLYGTTSVLSGAWRDNPDEVRARMRPAGNPVREALARPKPVAVASATTTPVAAKAEPEAEAVVKVVSNSATAEEKKA